MYTLDFTPSDLEANREGLLSERQQQRVAEDVKAIKQQGRQAIWGYPAFFIFFVVVGVVNEHNRSGQDLTKMFSPTNIAIYTSMAAIFGIMLILSLVTSWWSARAFAKASIRVVEGEAHLVNEVMGPRGMIKACNVELKRGRFSKFTFRFGNASSMRHFQEGRLYRVYYLPHSPLPQALSVEELDTDDLA